ncbi:hypothetical protein LINPERHAP1_LOCUS20400 [Linum perenne]
MFFCILFHIRVRVLDGIDEIRRLRASINGCSKCSRSPWNRPSLRFKSINGCPKCSRSSWIRPSLPFKSINGRPKCSRSHGKVLCVLNLNGSHGHQILGSHFDLGLHSSCDV